MMPFDNEALKVRASCEPQPFELNETLADACGEKLAALLT